MPNPFRFVLVGSGNISRTYVAAIEKLPDVRIVGVVSRSCKRPENMAADAPVEIADTLTGIKVDYEGVILTTPNGMHHSGTVEAANTGKHVLTEKPLAISVKGADEAIAACKENNVKLGVSYQSRTRPDNRVMKTLIEEKKLGRIFSADVSVKYYRDQDYYDSGAYRGTWDIDGGGAFTQQASHNVDLYCWYFGMPERVVSACDTFLHEMEAEDHGVALLRHADGMIGTITASTSCKPGFPTTFTYHAEKGTVHLENDIIRSWDVDGIENPSQPVAEKLHNGASSAAVVDTTSHEAIITDFIEALKEDREPIASGESAKMATELIERIYEAKI